MLMDDVKEKCKDIFERDGSVQESEPLCTDECKEAIMMLHNFGGDGYHCCSCGNIDDNRKPDDIRYTIQCNEKRRNAMRLCFNDMMQPPMMCKACHRQGNQILLYFCLHLLYNSNVEMNRTRPCFDVMSMCLKNRSCKMMMEHMERECMPVTTWNQCMRRPVCSGRCQNAVTNLFKHNIGRLMKDCDCRMPRRDGFVPMFARNEDFEMKCRRNQNNMRTFCFYGSSCRGELICHPHGWL